jgi:hypothetical protein
VRSQTVSNADKEFRRFEEVEKLLFNIGRILARQMTPGPLRRKRQILPLGRKGDRPSPLCGLSQTVKQLKYIDIF